MLTLPRSVRIYLATGPVDLRKSIDGLGALARERAHDRTAGIRFHVEAGGPDQVLSWDHGGFVLYYKRLERGRFKLPEVRPGALEVELDAAQLAMLLDGLDMKQVRAPARWVPGKKLDTGSAK